MDVDRYVPRTWLALAGLVGAFAFLGAAVTYFAMERDERPPDESSADVGFLQDMLDHHEQALTLSAWELQNGTTPAAQMFAREVMQQQSWEMGQMQRQLDQWGYARQDRSPMAMDWMGMATAPDEMPGLASDAELEALREAEGAEADALFMALMEDHHRGGVSMAAAAAEQASDPWVRDLAGRMARNQAIEINEMQATRERAGLDASPDGYEPGPFPDHGDGGEMPDSEDMDHSNG